MSVQNPLEYIRKESLDIYNRLHSIHEDIAFATRVHHAYPHLPFLPNLRCGAWYTDPEITGTNPIPVYFKSTDGHFNNWSFNLRRANLHLLPLVVRAGGLILVDSTRAGKKIPDALSKTVPIWCEVINRAMTIRYPDQFSPSTGWNTRLYTPPGTVSPQEHHQIEQRLDAWAVALANSSFDLPRLPHPLRPIWLTPATTTFPSLPSPSSGFLPIICVSASKQIEQGLERRTSGFSYVQGSGDDHELWGQGLTPALFWAHRAQLLEADRDDLPELVSTLVHEATTNGTPSMDGEILHQPSPIKHINGSLLIARISDIPLPYLSRAEGEKMAYVLLLPSKSSSVNEGDTTPLESLKNVLILSQVPSKKGQADFLDHTLPTAIRFIQGQLVLGKRICVACDSGKDQSVGVVLAAIQLFFDIDGVFVSPNSIEKIQCDKQTIRTRLEWIIASRPEANPSRATLKRVNEFLLTPPSFLRPPRLPS